MSRLDFSRYLAERTRDFTGRAWLFAALDRWLADPAGPRMFILAGEPGIGKSAIAGRLAQFSDGAVAPPDGCERLGVGFLSGLHICSARHGGWIDPEAFARSLSAQLAGRYPAFRTALRQDPHFHVEQHVEGDVKGTQIGVQIGTYYAESAEAMFNQLVRRPLRAAHAAGGLPAALVLLVDGLDEALDYTGRTTIVRLLATSQDMPAPIRLILTTRPVAGVLEPFRMLDPFVLHAANPENQTDLRAYAEERLRALGHLNVEQAVERLVQRGTGNFLVVSQVLDAVARGDLGLDDPGEWPANLYDLYAWFLERLTRGDAQVWRERYRPILGLLSVAREPVDAGQLQDWSSLSSEEVGDALVDLRQFLSPARAAGYRLYHQSVVDFLTNERAVTYRVDPRTWHARITGYYEGRYARGAVESRWSECDAYGLRHLPAHLAGAAEQAKVQDLLVDFGWLSGKLSATGISALIADFALAGDGQASSLVWDALRRGAQALGGDKTQLAGQLLGRLQELQEPEIERLCRQADGWSEGPWLRPLTASLRPPGDPLQYSWKRHEGTVRSLAITPDGRRAVSAGNSRLDRTLRFWDLEAGIELWALSGKITEGHTPPGLTPDGVWVLCGIDNEIHTWNLATHSPGPVLQGHAGPVNALAVAEHGLRAVSGAQDGSLMVWDLERWLPLHALPVGAEPIHRVAIDPHGHKALSVSDSHWRVWDLATGQPLHELSAEGFSLQGNPWPPIAACLSQDGKWALVGNRYWELETGQIRVFELSSDGQVVASSGDGRLVLELVNDKRILKIWNTGTGSEAGRLPDQNWAVSTAAITPDGRWAIVAYFDRSLKVWNLDSAVRSAGQPQPGAIASVGIARNGQYAIVVWKTGDPLVHDLATGRPVPSGVREAVLAEDRAQRSAVQARIDSFENDFVAPALSSLGSRPDEDWTIPPYQEAVLDLHSRYGLTTERIMEKTAEIEEPLDVKEETGWPARVWDIQLAGQRRLLHGHWLPVYAGRIAPDGKTAVTGGIGRLLRVWDLEQGQQLRVLRGHTGSVYGIAVSPDGRYVISVSEDATLRVWNLANGQPVATFSGENAIHHCAVSQAPDGSLVAVAGERLGRIHVLRLREA